MKAFFSRTTLAAVTILAATVAATPAVAQKAHYSEFTDSTWLPENTVRPPMGATEISVTTLDAMRGGVHAFYATAETQSSVTSNPDGTYSISETVTPLKDHTFNWGAGASRLYRNGKAVVPESAVMAQPLADGRVLVRTTGAAPFNLAVRLRAFDVSGIPVRHLLRDGNNQPTDLAWYMDKNTVMPRGSVVYQSTYWLGDDEIARPSASAFTGAGSLEKLLSVFSADKPFCLSYVNHQYANPYGVSFNADAVAQPRKKGKKNQAAVPQEGTFTLIPVRTDTVFCERNPSGAQSDGRWVMKTVQGTRVIELIPNGKVVSSDMGVQPVNADSITVGFAEVTDTPAVRRDKKGRPLPAKLQPETQTRVVPVRILHSNRAITDFRLKFNDRAAEAVRSALIEAQKHKSASTGK